MQTYQILINYDYTANTANTLITQNTTTAFTQTDNYYLYSVSNGGGLVNFSNVRGYFNDSRNQQVTTDFFAYLSGYTSEPDYNYIMSSDAILSNVFNDYYQRVYISGLSINDTSFIQQSLTGTTGTTDYEFNYPWSGYAYIQGMTGITNGINGSINSMQSYPYTQSYTNEQSYYVPICIKQSNRQLARYTYDLCDISISLQTAGYFPEYSGITSSYFGAVAAALSTTSTSATAATTSLLGVAPIITPSSSAGTDNTRIHTLLQCYVDLNLETNENINTTLVLPPVSFQFSAYSINEGNPFSVVIGLPTPSAMGIEQASVSMLFPNSNAATMGQNFVAADVYPLTLGWSAGEQYKYLNFTALTDLYMPNTEYFELDIFNLLNTSPGNVLNTNIAIVDTIVFNTVSLSVTSPSTSISSGTGLVSNQILDGQSAQIIVSLSGPSYGIETVTLQLVNSATTTAGVVGPFTNPAVLGTDFISSGSSIVFSFTSGQTQQIFNLSATTDYFAGPTKSLLYQLQNNQYCFIDSTANVAEIDIVDSVIAPTDKYVHLNLGTIYSEFGASTSNTTMRQLNTNSSSNKITVSNFANYLIQYGTSVTFQDYTESYPETISYHIGDVQMKIKNTGVYSSIVNGMPILTGQTITISVPGNGFVLTATTNPGLNNTTNNLDYASYQIEFVNNYSGSTNLYGLSHAPMAFELGGLNNTSAAIANTINLGNFLLSGMTTAINDTSLQYKLKGTYGNVITTRINPSNATTPVYTCPVPSFYGVDYNTFYLSPNEVTTVSILGVMFLNVGSQSTYNTFSFIDAGTTFTYTCGQVVDQYNSVGYINLPFSL